jgi:hypothetical protein
MSIIKLRNTHLIMRFIILLLSCCSIIHASRFEEVQIQAITEADSTVESLYSKNGYLNVYNNWGDDVITDLYLYRIDQTPVLTAAIEAGDDTLTVVSTTGIVPGDAITIYEDIYVTQTIVVSTTATLIITASPSDNAFTTDALVEVGPWGMSVDGSVTEQEFQVKCPPNATFHVHTVSGTMLDGTVMDDAKFGGLPALTKGILYSVETPTITKYAALIVNNTGFYEFGFETSYSDKAPAGSYGFRFRANLPDINGIVLQLPGTSGNSLKCIIRDDLTGLDQFTTILAGHLKY